ncbi:MAG: TraR/DksA family transcriptional regulator [Acidobacteriota bacterium]
MNKRSREKYQRILDEKRQALLAAYTKNKSRGTRVGRGGKAADMADMATDSYMKEFLYSLSNTERKILQAVEEALSRLDNSDFGECIECEERIDKKRLDAVPWARYCVNCQELAESGRLNSS